MTLRHKSNFLNVSRRLFVEKLATFDGSHMARAEPGEMPPKMSQYYYDFKGRWEMLTVTQSGKWLCTAVASRAVHLVRQKTDG